MNKTARNLIIFTLVTLTCGFAGIALDQLAPPPDPMQGLGALVWLVSPLLAVILLRAFGGDGWADFGLGLKLKTAWRWYLLTLAIVLVVMLVPLGLALLFGAAALAGFAAQGPAAFLSLVGVAFVSSAVKNIFEEFAWRGYLAPRFAALNLHPFLNALFTGFIWAGWHLPYYLYYLDPAVLAAHTSLSLPVFILSAFLVLPFHALAYNELRLLSGSTWTAWLLHTLANALSLPLISGGFVVLARDFSGALLSPGTEGILHSLLMGLLGLALYWLRKTRRVGL